MHVAVTFQRQVEPPPAAWIAAVHRAEAAKAEDDVLRAGPAWQRAALAERHLAHALAADAWDEAAKGGDVRLAEMASELAADGQGLKAVLVAAKHAHEAHKAEQLGLFGGSTRIAETPKGTGGRTAGDPSHRGQLRPEKKVTRDGTERTYWVRFGGAGQGQQALPRPAEVGDAPPPDLPPDLPPAPPPRGHRVRLGGWAHSRLLSLWGDAGRETPAHEDYHGDAPGGAEAVRRLGPVIKGATKHGGGGGYEYTVPHDLVDTMAHLVRGELAGADDDKASRGPADAEMRAIAGYEITALDKLHRKLRALPQKDAPEQPAARPAGGRWSKADRRRAHGHLSGARITGGRIGPHGERVLAEVTPEREAEAAAMHAEYIAAIRDDTERKKEEAAAHFRRQADENADSLSEDERTARREHLLEMAVRFNGYAAESRRDAKKLRALAARIRAEGMPPPLEGGGR